MATPANQPAANAGHLPVLLFGAFDRHNFGDLLFPHIVGSLLAGTELVYVGLAARDLRRYGGHRLRGLAEIAQVWRGRPVNLIHVGGELLTCEAWQAAVMLLPPRQAAAVIARFDSRREERQTWTQQRLGLSSLAPYTVGRGLFPATASICHNAVGGVDLASVGDALRDEVIEKLRAADVVSVRDQVTQAALAADGVSTQLLPDPGVMVEELFGARTRHRAQIGEVAATRKFFPRGYVAVQFSAEFGDDATLARLAAQFDEVAGATGYGIAFFRAGAAPWHDDLECYRRTARRMRFRARIFHSLYLWDICALIAASRGYCGSSLHGRIVATAFALPRVSLLHGGGGEKPRKQTAYVATWEPGDVPTTAFGVEDLANGLARALVFNRERLQSLASELTGRYRAGFESVRAALR